MVSPGVANADLLLCADELELFSFAVEAPGIISKKMSRQSKNYLSNKSTQMHDNCKNHQVFIAKSICSLLCIRSCNCYKVFRGS